MCFVTFLKVKKVNAGLAQMEDGRTVRLGKLSGVKPGDKLEVYADLALSNHTADIISSGKSQNNSI